MYSVEEKENISNVSFDLPSNHQKLLVFLRGHFATIAKKGIKIKSVRTNEVFYKTFIWFVLLTMVTVW